MADEQHRFETRRSKHHSQLPTERRACKGPELPLEIIQRTKPTDEDPTETNSYRSPNIFAKDIADLVVVKK